MSRFPRTTALLMAATLLLPATLACAQDATATPAAEAAAEADTALENENQKILYAMGVILSSQFAPLALSPEDVEIVESGFVDGMLGAEPQVEMPVFGPKVQQYLQQRAQELAAQEKAAGSAFIEAAAAEEGAVRTASGAVYKEIAAGDGETPGPLDRVRIHYVGTLLDGKVFDSSREKGEPAEFAVGGVIPCFGEGVQKMKEGGKAKLVCPSETAYGDRGSPPNIRPGATLIFEVELLEVIEPAASTPPAPPAPPATTP